MKTRLVRRTAVRRSRPREVVLVRRAQQQQASRTPRTALLAPLAVVLFSGCLLNALAITDARDAVLTPLLGLFAVAAMVVGGYRAALVLTALLGEQERR